MKFTNYIAFRNDFRQQGIEYATERSARLGFDSIEFLDLCPSETCAFNLTSNSDVRRACEQNGLQVACYSLGADLLANDQSQLKTQLCQQIEFAAEIGSPYFHHTLIPSLAEDPRVPSYEEVFDSIVETAVWIANRCKIYGLTCLYEPQGMYFNGVEGLNHLFERVRQECSNVAICGDVGNSLFVDTSPNDIYDAFITSIRHVHVKDFQINDRPFEDGVFFLSRGGKYLRECQLGEGIVDFEYCFKKMKDHKYQGAVSFELDGSDQILTKAIEQIRAFL